MPKKRIITPYAQQEIEDIAAFIYRDNPTKALEYLDYAPDTFFDMPENLTPTRAEDYLPEYVRKIPVKSKSFSGYFLYIAFFDDALFLIAALRPGLPNREKIYRTQQGIREARKYL